MRPFRLAVPQADLDDLQRRLQRTRLPAAIDDGLELGIPQQLLGRFVERWLDGYDWRWWEHRINRYPQFLADAHGCRLHVLHAPSARSDAQALVLTHGWPGSIVEFLECIEPLRNPPAGEPAFHVIVPSMPGYGFSGPTTREGVDADTVAAAIADVVRRLGYTSVIAQGGDWGGLVTRKLGESHSDLVRAIHCNMLFALPTSGERTMGGVTDAEKARMGRALERVRNGTGYMALQSTKPQSLAYSHADSPVGLLAWIAEKFYAWSDLLDGDIESVFTLDQIITNVMFYWLPNTAGSAARLYAESARAGSAATSQWTGSVSVPTGHAVYPGELLQTPRVWADARYNIVHWTEQPRGGHFAAFEQPELFVDDLRRFASVVLGK